MVDDDDQLVPRQHPVPEMTPAEFETFVASMFEQTRPLVEDLRVTLQEEIPAADGSYAFDATIRFRLTGMDFLVLVEAFHGPLPTRRPALRQQPRDRSRPRDRGSLYPRDAKRAAP